MDSATITYQLAGTVKTTTVEGGHITAQMQPSDDGEAVITAVTVSDSLGGRVVRQLLFRNADYVEITRGGGDDG
jgi:hypothetical protein